MCILCSTVKYFKNFRKNITLTLFNMLLWTPCGRSYLAKEERKMKEEFKIKWKGKRKNQVYKLPDRAWKEETILNRMETGSAMGKVYYTEGGKLSGGVYTDKKEHWDFISEVMRYNIESNPLHVVEFSFIGQLEAEIIKMSLELFHGPPESCGLNTSGGTESIMIACLAYREWGRKRGITKPNIVAP